MPKFVLNSHKNLKRLSPNKVFRANKFNSDRLEKASEEEEPVRGGNCAFAMDFKKVVWWVGIIRIYISIYKNYTVMSYYYNALTMNTLH